MKTSQLKLIIKKIISEARLLENIQDPSKDEMFNYLRTMYGNEEGFRDDAEVAIYWFANSYHGGQSSHLYSALSTSRFNPGPVARGPEPQSSEEMMYEDLVLKFAPGSEEAIEIQKKHNSLNEAVSPKNLEIIGKWMREHGARQAAYKMVNSVIKRRLMIGLEDMPDTATLASGLDDIEGFLSGGDFDAALKCAVETAKEFVEEEGGAGLMEEENQQQNPQQNQRKKHPQDDYDEAEINKLYKQISAEIDGLKQQYPKLSFGYIGNVWNDWRYQPQDDRNWYIFNGRNKFGGVPTKDLAKLLAKWNIEKEKFLSASDTQGVSKQIYEGDEADAVNDMWAGSDEDLAAHGYKEPTRQRANPKKFSAGGKPKQKDVRDMDWPRVKQGTDKGTLKENEKICQKCKRPLKIELGAPVPGGKRCSTCGHPVPIIDKGTLKEYGDSEQVIYKDRQGGQDVYWMDNKDTGGKIQVRPEAVQKLIKRGHRLVDLQDVNEETTNGGTQSLIDGQSNNVAASRVNKVLAELSRGMFSDDNWAPIDKIFKKLKELGMDVSLVGANYGGQADTQNGMPKFKEWQISIPFTNKNGRPTELVGQITAHGAGSIEQPLDRYDITAYVSAIPARK